MAKRIHRLFALALAVLIQWGCGDRRRPADSDAKRDDAGEVDALVHAYRRHGDPVIYALIVDRSPCISVPVVRGRPYYPDLRALVDSLSESERLDLLRCAQENVRRSKGREGFIAYRRWIDRYCLLFDALDVPFRENGEEGSVSFDLFYDNASFMHSFCDSIIRNGDTNNPGLHSYGITCLVYETPNALSRRMMSEQLRFLQHYYAVADSTWQMEQLD